MEDLNFHKVKKIFFLISFFLIHSVYSFAQNFSLEEQVTLNDPWGSSFLNNNELILTEKSGKIKITNIITKEVFEVDHNLNFVGLRYFTVYGEWGRPDMFMMKYLISVCLNVKVLKL